MPITPEMFEAICIEMETSPHGLYKVCREHNLSTTDFYLFIRNNGEPASLRYARAREAQCDLVADDMYRIADDTDDANKGRLQVDTRKWYLSKIKPKRYGDYQQIEIVGELQKVVQSMISIVREYVPEDRRQEAIGKLQSSIDFNG